jgi:hypothetical protein
VANAQSKRDSKTPAVVLLKAGRILEIKPFASRQKKLSASPRGLCSTGSKGDPSALPKSRSARIW